MEDELLSLHRLSDAKKEQNFEITEAEFYWPDSHDQVSKN